MTTEGMQCAVFRTEKDADAMREVVAWVRAGGMDDLRELSRLAANLRECRKTALHVAVWLLVGGALGTFTLGVRHWLSNTFRAGQ